MALPLKLFQNVTVQWVIPAGITAELYDTTSLYRSSSEAQNYTFLASIPFANSGVPQTFWSDASVGLAAKGSYHYMVVFSNSATGLISNSYLTYKALSPREQRLVLQLRDSLSRFITNRLADEEVRQYMDQGIQNLNVYSPTTNFDIFTLPASLEPLVILGAIIMGVANNMLGIGFTDISYSDQGFSLTATRMDKMTQTFDKVLGSYNALLAIAKLDYAEGGEGVGTVMLPIGMGGNLNRGIMNVFDLLSAVGR
jgi:hypothetical protein